MVEALHVLACNSSVASCGGGAPAPVMGSGTFGILLTLIVAALVLYAARKRELVLRDAGPGEPKENPSGNIILMGSEPKE